MVGFRYVELTDLVLSWSLEDIFNEDLFKNQVEKIPVSFDSPSQYFSSYVFPLLEETRAELASKMEIINEAPFAEVVSVVEVKPIGSSEYKVRIDYWRNKLMDHGKETYKTLPGDIMIFSSAKPETVSDLHRNGRAWMFASVKQIATDDDESMDASTPFVVQTLGGIELDNNQMQKPLYVVYLTNITTNKRIWKSLHMDSESNIIEQALLKSPTDEIDYDKCCLCDNIQGEEKTYQCLLSNLNDSQIMAISSSLRKMKCHHKGSVQLIRGPPGTGKTKTLSILLFILLQMRCRTVTCAPTNIAVKEVATRVVKLVRESVESSKADQFLPLANILIYGNKERMKVDQDIEKIYLDYRVDRLNECFGEKMGWKNSICFMIDFLKNSVSQYHVFVENESIKEKEHGLQSDYRKEKSKSFLEFAQEKFSSAASLLRRYISILLTHLPICLILERNARDMIHVLSLLESIERCLQDVLVPEELEELLSQGDRSEYSSEVFESSSPLLLLKKETLLLLRNLQFTFSELKLPQSRKSLKHLCFRNAHLIFCTASSSCALHNKKLEPLELLIIDEAAQLKECEATIPLQLPGVRHATLIGDECQLPALVNSKVSSEAGFGRSLFERLSMIGYSKELLNIQYRMHPAISVFPNSAFYATKILDAPNVKSKAHQRVYLPGDMFGPYSFINVADGKEDMDDISHSRRNLIEVAVVVKLLQNLYRVWKEDIKKKLSIGVISPYAAQVAAIQDKLGKKYQECDGFFVKVKSIDGFQGGEEDIIIISTVRSNKHGSIGFLSNWQRTNVALTRARHCLWILGNEWTLRKSESVWAALVQDAKDRGCFFDVHEDASIKKQVLKAKKELDQLDDLLNKDCVLFKTAIWKVVFSENFRKSFGEVKSARLKKSIVNLLLKLAGGWRPERKSVDILCESSQQIVKKFQVEGQYIVCTIDIEKEMKYTQVLKVWDLMPLEEIPKLLKRLEKIFLMYSDDYISYCKEKCFEGKLEVPMSWEASLDIIQFKTDNSSTDPHDGLISATNVAENSKVNESLLLMKFYCLSSGMVSYLLSDHNGREIDLPFEVTDEERQVIQFGRSAFILGRSGTGKTTVLAMKMFQKEHMHHIASEGFVDTATSSTLSQCPMHLANRPTVTRGSGLRQIFVTVSPKLCSAIKKHITELVRFAYGNTCSSENNSNEMDDMNETALLGDIPDSFTSIPAEKYPLVITFHKFLMMLDGSVGDSYFSRFKGVAEFPANNISLQNFIRKKEVNFDRFCSCYWPHFNTSLTKKFEPLKVFTEIMSYIKGSFQTEAKCILSREEYVSLSERRISTLCAIRRGEIYDIFKSYERLKMSKFEFDVADVVIDLHHRLEKEVLMGDKMDFVYIDEVQDLTMGQISLFKHICSNVDEGFVFSGDTAQTIARGIDFRFEDIRCLFFEKFVMGSQSGSANRIQKGHISDTFNLSRNFRTHTGVLKLAQSVIDLLYHFFPQSIDKLKPETSLIYGEPPVLLEPCNDENAVMSIFGDLKSSGGTLAGFGAEQVIIVRDDNAKEEVSSYIGRRALVLTILECKGLEFQDVLLYNFFGSSPLKDQWRVIYEFMKAKGLLDPTSNKSFPNFSHSKHSLMCSELKNLYVAITRTRQRLWISENSGESAVPVSEYWKKLGLVQVRIVDDSLAKAMQVASSPQEWKARGVKLLWEENYEMAMFCFERAGDIFGEKMAKAAGLRSHASRVEDSKRDEGRMLLKEAAEIYDSIGKLELAAECYIDLGDYERAGNIYMERGGDSDIKKAGECFMFAHCYEFAAEAYAKGYHFAECLSVCTEGKLFDKGLKYIEYWKKSTLVNSEYVDRDKDFAGIAQNFLVNWAIKFHALKDMQSMMKFVRAFDSLDSRRKFLKSVDCLYELLQLEEESGHYGEAALIANELGKLPLQADLLAKDGRFEDSCLLILWHVFSNSLWADGGKGWPLRKITQQEELLMKAKSIAEEGLLNELACTEIRLLSHEANELATLRQLFMTSLQHHCLRGQFIAVRKILDAHSRSAASRYVWEDELPVDLEEVSLKRLSFDQLSAETLIYFWDHLSKIVVNVHESLKRLQTKSFDGNCVGDFCLNFFGVQRKMGPKGTRYQLLIPDAHWVRKLTPMPIRKSGKLIYIDSSAFVSAARDYWQAVLLSSSLKVLETLKVLCYFSVKNCLSLFRQSICLIYMYRVTSFLLGRDFLDCKSNERLQRYCQLSHAYMAKVFRLDCSNSLTKNMICLRQGSLSQGLLSQIIYDIIGIKSPLTYGQIGTVMMLCMGSGSLTDELHRKIADRFGVNEVWKDLFGVFRENRVLESKKNNSGIGENLELDVLKINEQIELTSSQGGFLSRKSRAAPDKISFIRKFQKALECTFFASWRGKDCISPNCLLYLVNRLVLLTSCFQEYFFTTRSSFTEWVIHEQLETCHSYTLSSDVHFNEQGIYDFVIMIIRQLLSGWKDTAEWIEISNIDPRYYYPLLSLRLVILLLLISLSSGNYINVLKEVQNYHSVHLQLPLIFCDLLRHATDHGFLYVSMVADALKTIGDPLVIVSFRKGSPNITAPAAIFIGMVANSQKEDIFNVLFPTETTGQDGRTKAPDAVGEIKAGEHLPMDESSVKNSTFVTSSAAVAPITKNLASTQTSEDMIFDWGSFQAIRDYLKAGERRNMEKSIQSNLKDRIEENITLLTTAKALFSGNANREDEDVSLELDSMLDELNQISLSLDLRSEEKEVNVTQIEQLLERSQSRRPKLESLLNQVLKNNDETKGKRSVSEAQCAKQSGSSKVLENTGDWDYASITPETGSNQKKPATAKGKAKGKRKGMSKGRKRK